MAERAKTKMEAEELGQVDDPMAKARAQYSAQLEASLSKVMSMPEGRDVMAWVIFGVCRVEGESFAAASERITAHHEGRRRVGLELRHKLGELVPEQRLVMEREILDRQIQGLRFGLGLKDTEAKL